MEWKKIASMEYGKIVFHSIPYHALASVVALGKGGPLCKLNGGGLFFTHYFNMFYLHLQLSATMHFINNKTRRPMQLQP